MKKSRKQINKIILRFFAFVSIISVTLSAFCIGGNASSINYPTTNVTSAIGTLKASHPYIEFRNNSGRYSYSNNYYYYYNTVIVFLPKWISSLLPNSTDYSSSTAPNSYSEHFISHVSTIKADSEVLNVSYPYKVLALYLTGLNGFLTHARPTESFAYARYTLYYDGTDYYSSSSINTSSSGSITASVSYSSSNIFHSNYTFQGFGFPSNYQYFASSIYGLTGVVFETTNVTYSDDLTNTNRAFIVLGDIFNYAWDSPVITVDVSGGSSSEQNTVVIDMTGAGCSCNCGDNGGNVCDCDCGYYTEQLKQELIEYFDTNYVTKTMFLQYMGNLQSLAESYSSLARDYSVQANNYSSLAGGYSALARSYSELATELSGNHSLQEVQNSMIAEQNSIDNSRHNAEQSSRNAEQSQLDNIANGTTSPDSDISGGVAELSSKFDNYFNQIESFQSNLQTVPAEVSQAGAMVTSITQKLPSSIIVAITFMLIVFVVVKVLGR